MQGIQATKAYTYIQKAGMCGPFEDIMGIWDMHIHEDCGYLLLWNKAKAFESARVAFPLCMKLAGGLVHTGSGNKAS